MASSSAAALASSWPWRWCCASQAVQRLWLSDGVEGPTDLVTLYTSAAQVRADLVARHVEDEEVNSGVLAWQDAPRAMAFLAFRAQAPPTATAPPRREPPTVRRGRRSVRPSGVRRGAHMNIEDEVWQVLIDAGRASDLYERHSDPGTAEMARTLFLRPLRRFQDSIHGRLASWRRWSNWMHRHSAGADQYAPNEVQLGARWRLSGLVRDAWPG